MTVPDAAGVPFRAALRCWLFVGLNSFGGPAGQIAVLHREVVERRRWITNDRFLHALDLCMLLPGPEAQQLSVYVGWILHGVRGGLAAGLLFVLPGALAMLALSILYVQARGLGWFEALFLGVKAAVLIVIAEAVWRIGRRALRSRAAWILAAAAFGALFFFRAPFPAVIVGAIALGLAAERLVPGCLSGRRSSEPSVPSMRPSLARSARTLALGLVLWLAPLWLLAQREASDVLGAMGAFFAQAAVLTFGGAYAALAYTAEQAVHAHAWLSAAEMADGLGLAESTPGPLILVLQFVGFVGAHNHPGDLGPLLAGTLGSLTMLWATFVPCFLWIFLLAPWMERVRGSRVLSGALAAVTAAVVGVVLDLAAWFALHLLFSERAALHLGPATIPAPEWSSLRAPVAGLAALAAGLLVWRRWNLLAVLAITAAAGLALRWLGVVL